MMEQVHVREAFSEVLVFIDRNMGDRLHALEEAGKIILRETLREKHRIRRENYRENHNDGFNDGVSERPFSDR